MLEFIGDIAVMIFGVYAGIRLRRLQQGAIRTTRWYLLAALLWGIFSPVLTAIASYCPSSLQKESMILAPIAVAIWISYFKFSKRIRATFPTTA